MKVKRLQGKEPGRPIARRRSLMRKIMDKLMFWRKPEAEPVGLAAQLSDLWRPSEREELLEREWRLRQERITNSMLPDMEPQPEPKPDRRRLRRMRKEAKQLQKAAQKMTKLAVRGKIPLESILPLAFPELEKWKLPCPPKTQGLKPHAHVEVPEGAVQELVGGIEDLEGLAVMWSYSLGNLCAAVGAAALFLEHGGTEEDAMTILSGNCGPVLPEALAFAKVLRLVAPGKRREELARFLDRTVRSKVWRDWDNSRIRLSRDDLLALSGVCRGGTLQVKE